MHEDEPVQPTSEAVTECLNRVKRTTCRHCEEEVFWVKTPAGKHFLADNFEQRRELANIDGEGNTEAGQKHILCIPHVCPAMQERVRWPKGKRPAHPLKDRLWSLLIQAGVSKDSVLQIIDTAFKPEELIPIKRDPTIPGDRVFEKITEKAAPEAGPPVREWGIIREMARLLRETADRGSELNLADRQRLNVTADLAEAAVTEGATSELITQELVKIQASFEEARERFNDPYYHQHPAGPFLPIESKLESEGSD